MSDRVPDTVEIIETSNEVELVAETVQEHIERNFSSIVSELRQTDPLGTGIFGEVLHFEYQGNQFAIKIIRAGCQKRQNATATFRNEIACLEELQRDETNINICRMICSSMRPENEFILFELQKMNLWTFIKKGKPPREQKVKILIEFCDGMCYAHERGFIHRDLKPGNLLISSRNGIPMLTIGDWGHGTREISGMMALGCGTLIYRAPEVYKRDNLICDHYDGTKVDMFSGAMTMLFVFGEANPWEQLSKPRIMEKVLQGDRPGIDHLHETIQEILTKTWCPEPSERISFEELKELIMQYKDQRCPGVGFKEDNTPTGIPYSVVGWNAEA